MTTVAELVELPNWAAATSARDIPPQLLWESKGNLLDALACVAAVHYAPCQSVLGGPTPQNPLVRNQAWATAEGLSLFDRCFANCMRMNAWDYDAVHYGAGHASAILIPALISLFEEGYVGARDVLTGFVVGVEAMALLGESFAGGLRDLGYHPSSCLGGVSCALACSWAIGRSKAEISTAMDLAMTAAMGRSSQLPTSHRPFQLATAAASGLSAAVLASKAQSATAPREWWDSLLALEARGSTPSRSWGRPWALEASQTLIKSFPACGYIEPVVTAVAVALGNLGTDVRLEAWCLDRLEVHLPHDFVKPLFVGIPANLEQARFSLAYALAVLLIEGCVTPQAYDEAVISRRDLHALQERVLILRCGEVPRRHSQDAAHEGHIRLYRNGSVRCLALRMPARIRGVDVWEQAEHKFLAVVPNATELIQCVERFEEATVADWTVSVEELSNGREAE